MQLVAPLSSGILGADSGVARLYLRGTGTRASYFTDFEGTAAESATEDIQLDTNGAAEIYVDRLVRCEVFDKQGAPLRSFVAGDGAPAVEVRSRSFTGVDYATGQSAAGNPTTLQLALDSLEKSAGAADFNVSFRSTTLTLSQIAGLFDGFIINVKSLNYAAAGDGVTDDTASIQSALDAAAAGGSGGGSIVYFPPGTYRTTAQLELPAGVSLWGAGINSVFLLIDHATARMIHSGILDITAFQWIRDMTLGHAQDGTGELLSLNGNGTAMLVENCAIGNTHSNGRLIVNTSAAMRLLVQNCAFTSRTGINADWIYFTNGSVLRMNGCAFRMPDGVNTLRCINVTNGATYLQLDVDSCLFDASAVAALGTSIEGIVANQVAGPATVRACHFREKTAVGGTYVAITFGAGTGADPEDKTCVESNNSFRHLGGTSDVTPYIVPYDRTRVLLESREASVESSGSVAGGALSSDGLRCGTSYFHLTTSAADRTLTMKVPPPGSDYTVVVSNKTGGPCNFSFAVSGAVALINGDANVLLDNKTYTFRFRTYIRDTNAVVMAIVAALVDKFV